MNATQTLEHAAIRAHARGDRWETFWQEHGAAIHQAKPYHAGRYHRLVNRLLHLVCSGDPSGQEPAGEPWLLDDVPEQTAPHDTQTCAKCLLSFSPLRMVLIAGTQL